VGADSPNWRPINYRLRHHVVGRFLRQQGYRYIHAGSWWWPTRASDYAHENINYFAAVPHPIMLLFEQPLIAPFAQALDSPFVDERLQQWERVHRQFDALSRVPAQPGPKFVFAHILVPHPPYVFSADGSYVSRSLQGRRSRNENYANQVRLANRLVSRLVDRILSDSASPPVILVQGDEGPYTEQMGGSDAYRFRTMTPADIRFRSGILNAYHLPGRGADLLYPSISPVNSFRVVFNAYHGTSLPLLPDRVYRHDSEKRPYSLVDVTAVARGAENAGRQEPVSISRVVQQVQR
jgi:Sulfatase